MKYDLNELLGLTESKKITLSDVDTEPVPQTFEEWCEIHGEPEYIGGYTPTRNKDILVEDCSTEEGIVHREDFLTVDNKGKPNINYKLFVDTFAEENKCLFYRGIFYTPDGELDAQSVRRDIARSLGNAGITTRLDTPTEALFRMLKDLYSVNHINASETIIPLANGDLHLGKKGWVFKLGEKRHTPYRLSVNYNPIEKPTPLFDKWLNDVFDPEDIITIQEIMGYCLIPSTAVGEAFIIVGDGEAGKSGFGTILLGLLGNAATTMETQTLVTKQFQISTVENKLVAYDDDLGSAALTETNLFKKLITADTPIAAERKYADPYTFMSYCRIVASANFMLSSLYDVSNGFFRRLHPINVKPKQPDRKIIRNFYDMILEQEKEQILKWALVGLRRVMENGWKIHWSERSKEYMGYVKSAANHFDDFLSETCEFTSDEYDVATAELGNLYTRWCRRNGLDAVSGRRLTKWIVDNSERMKISRTNHVVRDGTHCRGFKGLRVKDEWKNVVIL
jgi:putative DNA primase/helicase